MYSNLKLTDIFSIAIGVTAFIIIRCFDNANTPYIHLFSLFILLFLTAIYLIIKPVNTYYSALHKSNGVSIGIVEKITMLTDGQLSADDNYKELIIKVEASENNKKSTIVKIVRQDFIEHLKEGDEINIILNPLDLNSSIILNEYYFQLRVLLPLFIGFFILLALLYFHYPILENLF